ncbi:MAG: Tex family protein [Sumerlaeia bacterium]
MSHTYHQLIAKELGIRTEQVAATAGLLAEGGTVPFIARYRKEATGLLDEVAITAIRDRLEQLAELDKRREAILASLEERDLLTPELRAKVEAARSLTELEDIYLPYRPKRRTRATIAREKGLEPLADALLAQDGGGKVEALAVKFVSAEKDVASVEDALAGARDIIAERVAEDKTARERMRGLYRTKATLGSTVAKGKEEEGAKFRDYFEWSEPLDKAPSHRLLAMFRGENEGVLKLAVTPPEAEAEQALARQFVSGRGPASEQVSLAVKDGFKRLLAPSMENEMRTELKKRADEEAIRVFVSNLRELLLAPPLGQKRVLAIDPGFRTGCKVVVLDAQGKLLDDTVIYPTLGEGRKQEEAGRVLRDLCQKHKLDAIAIGNGTASRETETFVRGLGLPQTVMMVDEAGASIYSASDVAREEFPQKDVTVRGAVSIGRRLMDPLAELVKIDPKSIGVGQYQHDVDQPALRRSLDDTVMSCVNGVGVEVNTASKELLTYVSGLGPTLAKNIVEYRNENGAFTSRAELKKVKRLGPKAFEQSAGFLRVRGAKNPLDASAVHPESYPIVQQMAKDAGCSVADLMTDPKRRAGIDLKRYVTDKVGLPTLEDILEELAKPGRDPRAAFEAFAFDESVHDIKDLKVGMKLPGIVTNVTKFGAFVDLGVHQDGLVHVSQLADHFVKDPGDVVKVRQKVHVTVMEVDIPRKRIALSMKANPSAPPQRGGGAPAHREDPKPAKKEGGGNWFTNALRGKKK